MQDALGTTFSESAVEEQLYAYLVERTNESTGEVESFGIAAEGIFVDDPNTRLAAGVSEPDTKHSYGYSVTLCKRTPTSLIDSAILEDEDVARGISFTRDHSKVANPMLSRGGAIVSTAGRFSSKTSGFAVEAYDGRCGVVAVTKMQPMIVKSGQIKGVQVVARDRYNFISWSWSGDGSQVDHFLIMASYSNIQAPIASVHSFSGYSNFHKDFELHGRVGKVGYTVIPVLIDYSQGTESKMVSITVARGE